MAHPPLFTTEEIDTSRIPVQGHASSGQQRQDQTEVSSLKLVHFVSFLPDGPIWFSCCFFCLRLPVLSPAGPSLLQIIQSGSFTCQGMPCRCFLEVACGRCYLNVAVTGLWYHYPRVQPKCRFPKERGDTLLREQGGRQCPILASSQDFFPGRTYFPWDQSRWAHLHLSTFLGPSFIRLEKRKRGTAQFG